MTDQISDRNNLVRVDGSITPAAGDIPISSLAAGLSGQLIGGTVPSYLYPAGYEIAYNQITSPVNIASTTEATPTSIIAGSAKTYEAVAYLFEFCTPEIVLPSTTGGTVTILFIEDTVSIGRLCVLQNDITGGQSGIPLAQHYRYTPAAGSHTYGISAFCSATTGTPSVQAGAAGINTLVPAFLRATKC